MPSSQILAKLNKLSISKLQTFNYKETLISYQSKIKDLKKIWIKQENNSKL